MHASVLVGPIAGPIFEFAVKEPAKKALAFPDQLHAAKSLLEGLKPVIEQLRQASLELDRPLAETARLVRILEEGGALVARCEKGKSLKYAYKRPGYTTELRKWVKSVDNELLKVQLARTARDVAELLVLARSIYDDLGRLSYPLSSDDGGSGGGGLARMIKNPCEALKPPEFTVGLGQHLAEVKRRVLEEGDSRVLVVTAPPGCGKTTLAQLLCDDAQIKEKFKRNIMFVRVTKNFDLNLIVHQLYRHNGYQEPRSRDNVDLVILLEQLMREISKPEDNLMSEIRPNPILLVLDDVWSGLGESLVEKFIFQIPEYKILVTSRSSIRRFENYALEALHDNDAMALFRHFASLDDGSSGIPDDLVQEVVENCKQHPLALKLIGTSLRGELPAAWRMKQKKWSGGSSSILESESELLACLRSSLDVFDEDDAVLKECFLDLGSFPEDQRIPATALIDMWTELYGIEEDVAIANLSALNQLCLANLVLTRKDVDEYDDYYSEHFATRHDMIRALAIHESSQESEMQREKLFLDKNNLSELLKIQDNKSGKWWKKKKKKCFNARLVSITADGSFSSEWCNIQLPKAEALILNFQAENYAIPEFANSMTKLKVLIITNSGFFPAKITNFELLGSLANQKRIRLERIAIPSLSKTSIKLENLQKLSLFMCKIDQAFSSIEISKIFKNLTELNIDYCNDLVALPAGLKKLKKLSVAHCHRLSSLPQDIRKTENLEVLRLRSCIILEILPESICELSKLNFIDISDCFSIRDLPENIGELHSLTKLNLRGCSRLQHLPPSVLDFDKLEVVCDEELEELWKLHLPSETNIDIRVAREDINLNWL